MEFTNKYNTEIHPTHTIKEHTNSVEVVQFHPNDSNTFLSASHDASVKIWDLSTLKSVTTIEGIDTGCWCATYTQDGSRIIAGSSHGDIFSIDPKSGVLTKIALEDPGKIHSLHISPDNKTLVIGGDNNFMGILDMGDLEGKPLASIKFPSAVARCSKFTPSGNRVVSTSLGGGFHVYDAETLTELASVAHTPKIEATFEVNLEEDSEGNLEIISADSDKTFRVYKMDNVAEGEKHKIVETFSKLSHGDALKHISKVGDEFIFTGSRDGTGKLWNQKDYEYMGRLVGHTDQIVSSTYHKDHPHILVTGGWDLLINVHNLDTLP